MFSQIKDTKHIERNFHSVAWVMPQGRDLSFFFFWGGGGVTKTLASGFPMATHRLRVVVRFKVFSHFQPRFAAGDGRHSSSHCDMSGPTQ